MWSIGMLAPAWHCLAFASWSRRAESCWHASEQESKRASGQASYTYGVLGRDSAVSLLERIVSRRRVMASSDVSCSRVSN